MIIPGGSILYEMFSPNVYLVHNRGDASLGLSISSIGLVTAMWHGDIIFRGSTGAIKKFDVAAETISDLVASANTRATATMRMDEQGRLVTANSDGARRYTSALSIDTTVTLTPPVGYLTPDVVAIAPDGDTIYGARHSPNLDLYQWSIDAGGGTGTLLLSRAPGRAIGFTALGVDDATGTALLAFEQVTGSGNLLSDPYVKRFYFGPWNGLYDITGQVPDLEVDQVVPGNIDTIVLDPFSNEVSLVMAYDEYNGRRYAYFPLSWNRVVGEVDHYFVARVDIESGLVDLMSDHPKDNSLGNAMAGPGSNLLIYQSVLESPGLSRFNAVTATQEFFVRT